MGFGLISTNRKLEMRSAKWTRRVMRSVHLQGGPSKRGMDLPLQRFAILIFAVDGKAATYQSLKPGYVVQLRSLARMSFAGRAKG
jgi:hypothetical protein